MLEKPSSREVAPSPESESRKLLRELEESGEFLLHGSPTPGIDELEVKPPNIHVDGEDVPHGVASVVASPFADSAIFHAIVRSDDWGFGMNDGGLTFQATKRALDDAKFATGYVYVVPRDGFQSVREDGGGMEWRSSTSQKPTRVVEVSYGDLPKDIQIMKPTTE